MTKTPAYDKLAVIYDHIMSRIRYDDWADYIFAISKKYITKKAKALELAGGNCSLSNHLKKYYPNLIVTDNSKWMLFNDHVKTLPKVCCDMSQLPFKTKFDLIFSTFDSVNYLTSKKKLLNLFKEVKGNLSDNGIFTFDASLERNSYIHIRQPLRTGSFNDIHYVHQTMYDEKRKVHKNIFKIKFDDGSTFKEIHRQKIYSFEDYFLLIEKAGLFVVECLESFSFKDAKATSTRAQFILKKGK